MSGLAEYPIVDGDGHVMEPDDLWLERMDKKRWGDWIPYRTMVDGRYETTFVGGQVRGGGKEFIEELCAKTGITPEQYHEMLAGLRVAGGHDPVARLADMDRDGIDAAVLYASQALFFGPVSPIESLRDVEFVHACQRAYNAWIAEYCQADPRRLFAMGAVPLQDIDRAVEEVERCINGLGHKGVFIRPSAYIDELPLNHPVYDRFWAACQDLDAAVAFHPGSYADTPGACKFFRLVSDSPNIMASSMAMDEIHGGAALGQAVGNTVDMIVTMGRIVMGGVCERFPRLRFLFLEAGGGWIPTQVERMDEQVKAFPLERRWLSMLPSEYFARQCYAGFEAEEWNLAASAEFLGTDRVIWASDYPHPEFHPDVVKELLKGIAPLAEPDQARVAGGNAVEAYKLDI